MYQEIWHEKLVKYEKYLFWNMNIYEPLAVLEEHVI